MSIRSGHYNGTAFELHGSQDLPAVALIHGLGLTRETWAEFVGPLSARYRVLIYDLYGHGASRVVAKPPTLRTYSDQLRGLVEALDLGVIAAVGFSLGGMINRRFAMDNPDLVSSLVILNSPHERTPEAQVAVEQRARDSAAAGPSANLDETLRRWFTPSFLQSNPETVTQIAAWVRANDPKAYAECRYVLANGVVELIRPEPPITHPTFVITCENDSGSTPEMAHAIASEIAGAELQIVPDLQHLGLIERPDLFINPISRFLSKHG